MISKKDVELWREPKTKAFSNVKNPIDKSCDNGVLFSAEATRLGLITLADFEEIAEQYFKDGYLIRYPGVNDWMSWDDYVGAASVSVLFAGRILDSMEKSNWHLPNGDWLGRFPILAPILYASARAELNSWQELKACVAYLWNLFESKKETSGKLILWLAKFKLRDKGPLIGFVICLWEFSILIKYKTISNVFKIYFSEENHPFPIVSEIFQ